MNAIGSMLITIIHLYIYIIVAAIVVSWLINFNVLNTRNQLVYRINRFLEDITEPALRPIRQVVPLIGGIDISPVILILLLTFLQRLILEYWYF